MEDVAGASPGASWVPGHEAVVVGVAPSPSLSPSVAPSSSPAVASNLRSLIAAKEKELVGLSERRLQTLNARARDLEDRLRAKETELATTKQQFAQLTADFKYNLNLLEDRDAELEQLDAALAEHKESAAARDAAATQARTKLADLEAERKRERAKAAELESFYKDKVERIAHQVEEARDQRDQELQRQQGDFRATEERLRREAQDAKAETDRVRCELQASADSSARQAEESHRARVHELEDQVRRAEDRAAEHARELQSIRELVSNSDSQQAELKASLSRSESQRRAAVSELESTVRERDKRIAELEAERVELTSSQHGVAAEYERKVAELIATMQEFEQRAETERGAAAARAQEAEQKHKDEVAVLTANLQAAVAARADVSKAGEAALRESQTRLRELEARVRDSDSGRDKVVRELTEARQKLESTLAAKDRELHHATAQLEQLQRSSEDRARISGYSGIHDEVSSLEEKVAALSRQLTEQRISYERALEEQEDKSARQVDAFFRALEEQREEGDGLIDSLAHVAAGVTAPNAENGSARQDPIEDAELRAAEEETAIERDLYVAQRELEESARAFALAAEEPTLHSLSGLSSPYAMAPPHSRVSRQYQSIVETEAQRLERSVAEVEAQIEQARAAHQDNGRMQDPNNLPDAERARLQAEIAMLRHQNEVFLSKEQLARQAGPLEEAGGSEDGAFAAADAGRSADENARLRAQLAEAYAELGRVQASRGSSDARASFGSSNPLRVAELERAERELARDLDQMRRGGLVAAEREAKRLAAWGLRPDGPIPPPFTQSGYPKPPAPSATGPPPLLSSLTPSMISTPASGLTGQTPERSSTAPSSAEPAAVPLARTRDVALQAQDVPAAALVEHAEGLDRARARVLEARRAVSSLRLDRSGAAGPRAGGPRQPAGRRGATSKAAKKAAKQHAMAQEEDLGRLHARLDALEAKRRSRQLA